MIISFLPELALMLQRIIGKLMKFVVCNYKNLKIEQILKIAPIVELSKDHIQGVKEVSLQLQVIDFAAQIRGSEKLKHAPVQHNLLQVIQVLDVFSEDLGNVGPDVNILKDDFPYVSILELFLDRVGCFVQQSFAYFAKVVYHFKLLVI